MGLIMNEPLILIVNGISMNEVNKVINHLYTQFLDWYEKFIDLIPNLVVGFVLLIVFWLCARMVKNIVARTCKKFGLSPQLVGLLSKLSKVIVLLLGLFIVLEILNLNKTVTSLLAGVGVVGIALGFAFQDIAANLMAGVLLSFNKSFNLGDLIKVNSYVGRVKRLSLRSTIIETFQGQDVIIPNSDIYKNIVVNYNTSLKRRIDIDLGVGYGSDLVKVKEYLSKELEKKLNLNSNQITIYYSSFGDSSINCTIRFWVENDDFLSERSKAIIYIQEICKKYNIEIPYPKREIFLNQTQKI